MQLNKEKGKSATHTKRKERFEEQKREDQT
jgi:hypothetical protein